MRLAVPLAISPCEVRMNGVMLRGICDRHAVLPFRGRSALPLPCHLSALAYALAPLQPALDEAPGLSSPAPSALGFFQPFDGLLLRSDSCRFQPGTTSGISKSESLRKRVFSTIDFRVRSPLHSP